MTTISTKNDTKEYNNKKIVILKNNEIPCHVLYSSTVKDNKDSQGISMDIDLPSLI